MKIELEKVSDGEIRVSITVPVTAVERELTRVYRKLRKEVSLPGSQQGKVPRKVLDEQYGTRISNDVSARLVDQALEKARSEHGLLVVGMPEYVAQRAKTGRPMKLTANVQVKPELKITDYKGLRVEREAQTVTDEEIEQHIDSMREQTGVHQDLGPEDTIADGDLVDVTLTLSDPTYGDLVREHQLSRLPDDPTHPFLPDMLRGKKIGQSTSAEVKMSDNYVETSFAGRRCKAVALVHDIQRVKPRPLDDEFAKQMGVDTVEQLRDSLRGRLLTMKARRGGEREVRQAIRAIIERNRFDVPGPLVAKRAQTLVDSIAAHMMGAVDEKAKPTVEDLEDERRDELLAEAEFSVRRELILEAIARQEKLTVEDEERDAHIAQMAAQSGHPPEHLKALLIGRDAISEVDAHLLAEKAAAWLLEQAEIVEQGEGTSN